VTLGTFDGVHRGHAAILAEAVRRGRGAGGSAAVTFARHPRAVLTPEQRPLLLTTLEERIPLLAAHGLDRLFILHFEPGLQEMEYDDFVRRILRERLGMEHLVLGYDVHFGRGRRGTAPTVAALAAAEGFDFVRVDPVTHCGEAVSSTRIRGQVETGDLDEATALLGHPFPVRGRVVEGRGDGRRLGFPTANLELGHPAKLLPPDGVYAAWARWEDAWAEAVLNLGTAPTFGGGEGRRLEVHVLGASPHLYGSELEVAFGPRLREERRFSDLSTLVEQIGRDAAAAPRALARVPRVGRPEALDRPGQEGP
jgi:riboflavin kinase/FMN adenylyltransferase